MSLRTTAAIRHTLKGGYKLRQGDVLLRAHSAQVKDAVSAYARHFCGTATDAHPASLNIKGEELTEVQPSALEGAQNHRPRRRIGHHSGAWARAYSRTEGRRRRAEARVGRGVFQRSNNTGLYGWPCGDARPERSAGQRRDDKDESTQLDSCEKLSSFALWWVVDGELAVAVTTRTSRNFFALIVLGARARLAGFGAG